MSNADYERWRREQQEAKRHDYEMAKPAPTDEAHARAVLSQMGCRSLWLHCALDILLHNRAAIENAARILTRTRPEFFGERPGTPRVERFAIKKRQEQR